MTGTATADPIAPTRTGTTPPTATDRGATTIATPIATAGTDATRTGTLTAVTEIVDCLDRGGNTRCTFRDGLVGVEIGMAFHESHRLGNTRVDWPLTNRTLRVMAR